MVALGPAGQRGLERALEVAALASAHVQRLRLRTRPGRSRACARRAAGSVVFGSDGGVGAAGARCCGRRAGELAREPLHVGRPPPRGASSRSEITASMSARRWLASSTIRCASAIALAIVFSASAVGIAGGSRRRRVRLLADRPRGVSASRRAESAPPRRCSACRCIRGPAALESAVRGLGRVLVRLVARLLGLRRCLADDPCAASSSASARICSATLLGLGEDLARLLSDPLELALHERRERVSSPPPVSSQSASLLRNCSTSRLSYPRRAAGKVALRMRSRLSGPRLLLLTASSLGWRYIPGSTGTGCSPE